MLLGIIDSRNLDGTPYDPHSHVPLRFAPCLVVEPLDDSGKVVIAYVAHTESGRPVVRTENVNRNDLM